MALIKFLVCFSLPRFSLSLPLVVVAVQITDRRELSVYVLNEA